jgi:peptidyl-prolyl cis-trans isomerase C
MKSSLQSRILGVVFVTTGLVIGVGLTPRSQAAVGALDGFADLFPDKTLASGKGVKVTRNELDQAFIYIKANKAAQGLIVPEAQRDALEAQLLEKLITTKLIMVRANKAELKKGEEFREAQLKILQQQIGSEEAMERHIIASGVTRDYFLKQLYEEGVVKAVIERELKGNYQVPSADIRKAYQENQQAFTVPEAVHLQRIFMARISPGTGDLLPEKELKAKEALMEQVRQKAIRGEDFAQLAKTHSEDPLTRNRGGEVVIAKGQTKPEFETPVFKLRPGAVSSVLTIGAGLHLVKMLEHIPAKVRPLSEVETAIRRNLEGKYLEERLPAYLDKLMADANVKITNEP